MRFGSATLRLSYLLCVDIMGAAKTTTTTLSVNPYATVRQLGTESTTFVDHHHTLGTRTGSIIHDMLIVPSDARSGFRTGVISCAATATVLDATATFINPQFDRIETFLKKIETRIILYFSFVFRSSQLVVTTRRSEIIVSSRLAFQVRHTTYKYC